MRHLASIQRVWDVLPIEGATNIELVKVLGWQCVANKGQFKKGDLGVYFEIDSFLPIRPEFEFLRASSYKKTDIMGEGFKLRTMKFRGQISQGLILPLDRFGELPSEQDVAVGMDVTEWLGVKKWEIEERATTGGCVVGTLPYDVPHTDEVRCFTGNTKIITDLGLLRIQDIVNKQIKCKALTYNEQTKEVEWNQITNYYKRTAIEPTCSITFPFKYNENRTNTLTGSLDHKILTQNGWTQLKDVQVNDTIYISTEAYTKDVIPFIAGMLLGDAGVCIENRKCKNGISYNKRRVSFTQGEKQLNYLKEKLRLLNSKATIRKGKSGYCNNAVYSTSIEIDDTLEEWFVQVFHNKKKMCVTSEYVKYLTPASFAIWYMDDGAIHRYTDRNWSPQITLSTEAYTEEENNILVERLHEFGIDAKVYKTTRNNKEYYNIHLSVDGTKYFQKLIAPYIFPEMRYKLEDEYKNINYELSTYSAQKNKRIIGVPILSKEIKHPSKHATNTKLYNIETIPNHNYFASRTLVHNCQACPELLDLFGNYEYYISTKMDGSSHSISLDENGFHVTGHNYEYRDDGSSAFYRLVNARNYRETLEKYKADHKWNTLTIQGEFCAPGIQKNRLKLIKPEWYVFTVRINGERVGLEAMEMLCKDCNLNMVPIEEVGTNLKSKYPTVEAILARADGEYPNGGKKEGIVVRTTEPVYCTEISGPLSFKAVSNKYLLKNDE